MANVLELCDMVDLQDLPDKTIEVDMQDFHTFTIDKIDLWEHKYHIWVGNSQRDKY